MEELGEEAGQTPFSWNKDFSVPDRGVVHCREVTVMEQSNSQIWGFFDPLHSEVSNMVSCSFPPFLVASSKDLGALQVQSLLVSRKSGGMKSDGCCVTSELHVRYMFAAVTCSWKNCDLNHVMSEAYSPMVLGSFFLEILDVQRWTLKLGSRGVMCVDSRCFFCMLKTRMIDDLAEDGGSSSFGSIHQQQVRASLLLIPMFDERESHGLSSVLHPRDLKLNHPLPLVHLPLDCCEKSPAIRLANTKEVFEDINCGWASELSLVTHHHTPVVVFHVLGLLSVVLVLGLCKDALMYSLFTRAL